MICTFLQCGWWATTKITLLSWLSQPIHGRSLTDCMGNKYSYAPGKLTAWTPWQNGLETDFAFQLWGLLMSMSVIFGGVLSLICIKPLPKVHLWILIYHVLAPRTNSTIARFLKETIFGSCSNIFTFKLVFEFLPFALLGCTEAPQTNTAIF